MYLRYINKMCKIFIHSTRGKKYLLKEYFENKILIINIL
jgi:hypothetical protein